MPLPVGMAVSPEAARRRRRLVRGEERGDGVIRIHFHRARARTRAVAQPAREGVVRVRCRREHHRPRGGDALLAVCVAGERRRGALHGAAAGHVDGQRVRAGSASPTAGGRRARAAAARNADQPDAQPADRPHVRHSRAALLASRTVCPQFDASNEREGRRSSLALERGGRKLCSMRSDRPRPSGPVGVRAVRGGERRCCAADPRRAGSRVAGRRNRCACGLRHRPRGRRAEARLRRSDSNRASPGSRCARDARRPHRRGGGDRSRRRGSRRRSLRRRRPARRAPGLRQFTGRCRCCRKTRPAPRSSRRPERLRHSADRARSRELSEMVAAS